MYSVPWAVHAIAFLSEQQCLHGPCTNPALGSHEGQRAELSLTGLDALLQAPGNDRKPVLAPVYGCLATEPAAAPASQATACAGLAAGAGPLTAAVHPERPASIIAGHGRAMQAAPLGRSAGPYSAAQTVGIADLAQPHSQPHEDWWEFACKVHHIDAERYFSPELRGLGVEPGIVAPLLVIVCRRRTDGGSVSIDEPLANFMRHGANALAFSMNGGPHPDVRSKFVRAARDSAVAVLEQGPKAAAFVAYQPPRDVMLFEHLPLLEERFTPLTSHPEHVPQLSAQLEVRASTAACAKRPRTDCRVASFSGSIRDAPDVARDVRSVLASCGVSSVDKLPDTARERHAVRSEKCDGPDGQLTRDTAPLAVQGRDGGASSLAGGTDGEGRAARQRSHDAADVALSEPTARDEDRALAFMLDTSQDGMDVRVCVSEPGACCEGESAQRGEHSSGGKGDGKGLEHARK